MLEEPDIITKSKDYGLCFPSSVVRQAEALFWSYLDDMHRSNATRLRIIYTSDGEQIRTKNEEEFYFRYDDDARTTSAFVTIKTGLTETPSLLIQASRGYSSVTVELPGRDHVDNVLQLFTREESRLVASLRQEGDSQGSAEQETLKLTVFIGHGHDAQWERLRDFLRRDERLNVIYYESGSTAGRTFPEVLQEKTEISDMAFLVHTGEDEDKFGASRARDNVVHEAGLFQNHLGVNRAIVLLEEGCAEYSNIKGIGQIRFAKGQIETVFGDVIQTIIREFPRRL